MNDLKINRHIKIIDSDDGITTTFIFPNNKKVQINNLNPIKVVLEFDLPDSKNDLILFVKRFELWSVLSNMDNWLRDQIKYCEKEEYEPVREKLYELMNQEGITMDLIQ